MNTARKLAASSTIGLGLAMVSVALPSIANAADTEEPGVSVPAGAPSMAELSARAQALGLDIPADLLADLDLDDLEDLARDLAAPDPDLDLDPDLELPTPAPTDPSPTTPEPTDPTEPEPTTPTPGDPLPSPTTPAPTLPTRPTPGDSADPGTPGDVDSDDDSTPGDDTGDSDPGSGTSASQGGSQGSNVDPVLGTGVAPQGLQDAPAPAQAKGALPDAGSPGQLPVLALGLGLIVVGGVVVKRPYAARHRV